MHLDGKYELLIIRNKYLKNTLEMTEKLMAKAQPLFSKSLSNKLGYPEKQEEITKKQEVEKVDKNSKVKFETGGEIVEAKKEQKDENLKTVFRKIALKIHPDKLEKLPQFEKEYKKSLFEKARMSLEVNDYYGIVEVAEELGIKPPPPNEKQIEMMKKTNGDLEKKIKETQNSVLWSWYYADEEAREFLMSKYIEKLQQMHAGT